MVKNKNSPGNVVLTIVSIVCVAFFLFPVIWMIAVSVKTEGTPIKGFLDWFLPPYTLENYPHVITKSKVTTWMFNSIFVATIVTACVVFISAMAAYAISKIKFRFKGFIYFFLLLGLMVPGEATIVPLFVTARELNIIDSFAGIILPALAGSMSVIIMRGFFDGIPNDLIESATIDGAGYLRIFANVILPLGKTVMVTIAIFTFIGNWNNFLWPYLCVMDDTRFTLPVGIPTFMGQYTKDYVLPMTVNGIASIPVIILFLIFEKQIIKGVTLTGIKG